MKKIVYSIVITLSIVVIILAVDYNNSKYAKGIFFRYHFLSDNILMLKMDGETMYYTYFSEDDKSAKNNNIDVCLNLNIFKNK